MPEFTKPSPQSCYIKLTKHPCFTFLIPDFVLLISCLVAYIAGFFSSLGLGYIVIARVRLLICAN